MASRNAMLTFGLVNIPVGVSSMTKPEARKNLRTLHAPCGTPISQKKVCPTCDVEVSPDDSVSGYEVAKGEFVQLTHDEVEATKQEASAVITLSKFSPGSPPLFVESARWLTPRPGSEHSYFLLMEAMTENEVFGIATSRLWGKEHPGVIICTADGFCLFDVYPAVLWMDPGMPSLGVIGKDEVQLASNLVAAMTKPWEQDDFKSAERSEMDDLIQAKLAGKEWAQTMKEKALVQTETPDIQEILRKSIAETKKVKAHA